MSRTPALGFFFALAAIGAVARFASHLTNRHRSHQPQTLTQKATIAKTQGWSIGQTPTIIR
jgi:hypothetical protein